MTLIANDVLTFADWASRRDPKGQHAMIAEVMSRKDDAFADIKFMEANQPLSHKDTLRSELPQGEFRAFNEGSKECREADFLLLRKRLAEGSVWGEELVDEVLARAHGKQMQSQ